MPRPGGRGRRALITGGAGFLGVYVVSALVEAGYEVHVADVQRMDQQNLFVLGKAVAGTIFHRASVTDGTAVSELMALVRPKVVVHLAALVDRRRLAKDPFEAVTVNVGGTVNVLQAASGSAVDRAVLFSSLAVLAPRQYEPIDVRHPTIVAREGGSSGFYGASKLASEAFGLAFASSHSLDVRIVRPSAAYGLAMPPERLTSPLKEMVEGAVDGRPVQIEAGTSIPLSFTHASDIAALTRAILDGPVDSDRVFFGATGGPLVTLADLAPVVRRLVPGAKISVAAGSEATDPEARYRGVLDIRNAQSQLGWSPTYTNPEDGIRRYIDDYRAFTRRSG